MSTIAAKAPALTPAQDRSPANVGVLGVLDPAVLDAALRAADMLANSSIVPKDFQGKPGNVLVAIQWGAELGLPPLQAMQNIAVINGRPSIWGDALLALVRGSGALEWIKETIDADGDRKSWVATCAVKRRGQDTVSRSFSWEDAETAGLARKDGPWKQYPKRMLQMRARSFALRDVFPDVLRGLYVAEEAQDMPPEVMRDVTPEEDEEPKPASRTAALAKKVTGKNGKAGPKLGDVLKRLEAATTEDEVSALADDCAKLKGDDLDAARAAYRAALDRVKANQQDDDAPVTEDEQPGGWDAVFDGIMTAMVEAPDAAGVDAVLAAKAAQIAQLQSEDPELHARLIGQVEQIKGMKS